jgi:hypothetical protein
LEGNPLSPPEGEAACGEHHLDPLFFGVFFNLIRCYRNRGNDESGGGGSMKCKEPPRAIDCFYEGFNKADYNKKTAFPVLGSGRYGRSKFGSVEILRVDVDQERMNNF